MEATDKLNDFLPANFRLIRGEPLAIGVANLELNADLVKPIKKSAIIQQIRKRRI